MNFAWNESFYPLLKGNNPNKNIKSKCVKGLLVEVTSVHEKHIHEARQTISHRIIECRIEYTSPCSGNKLTDLTVKR